MKLCSRDFEQNLFNTCVEILEILSWFTFNGLPNSGLKSYKKFDQILTFFLSATVSSLSKK